MGHDRGTRRDERGSYHRLEEGQHVELERETRGEMTSGYLLDAVDEGSSRPKRGRRAVFRLGPGRHSGERCSGDQSGGVTVEEQLKKGEDGVMRWGNAVGTMWLLHSQLVWTGDRDSAYGPLAGCQQPRRRGN
jgi:hypothetical protein